MEIRTVSQYRQIGVLVFGHAEQLSVFAINAGQVGDHFDQSDHGETGGIDDLTNSSIAHSGPAAAEKVEIRAAAAKGGNQTGGVEVAGGFTRGNQDFTGHFV